MLAGALATLSTTSFKGATHFLLGSAHSSIPLSTSPLPLFSRSRGVIDKMEKSGGAFQDKSNGVVAFNVRNEQLVREYQIAIEGMTLVRERLAHCVRTEGVNQVANCKELREQYFALCNDRFRGMIFPEDSQPVNRFVPGLVAPKTAK